MHFVKTNLSSSPASQGIAQHDLFFLLLSRRDKKISSLSLRGCKKQISRRTSKILER
jgi:hypothetical protein